jgi:hypothetical protein
MVKSYSQKADAIYKALEKNPNLSASAIYNRYKGSELGMRKTDSLELTKAIKDQLKAKADFEAKINNSNMTDKTKAKLTKIARQTAYKSAKNNTKRGKEENKKGIIYGNVQGLTQRTFNKRRPNADGFTEFY